MDDLREHCGRVYERGLCAGGAMLRSPEIKERSQGRESSVGVIRTSDVDTRGPETCARQVEYVRHIRIIRELAIRTALRRSVGSGYAGGGAEPNRVLTT
jgi:hypothetical protein